MKLAPSRELPPIRHIIDIVYSTTTGQLGEDRVGLEVVWDPH